MSKKAIYLGIDTETTGLSPSLCGIIQLAGVALDKNLEVVDTFNVDIKPDEPYTLIPKSLEINGFTMDRINNGTKEETVVKNFINFISNNFANKPIIIAQFWPFDFAVLEKMFSKHKKIEFFAQKLIGNNFIDTKSIVNQLNLEASLNNTPIPFPVTSLSSLGGVKDVLQMDQSKYQAHDALGDVIATIDVLKKLTTKN